MNDAYDPGNPKAEGYTDALLDAVPSREERILTELEGKK